MTHDKQFSLVLIFILDESQDLAPRITRVFEQNIEWEKLLVPIICYDVNQSIYLWLNNEISVIKIQYITLTRTFRFGCRIAAYANEVISLINHVRDGKCLIQKSTSSEYFIVVSDTIYDEVVCYYGLILLGISHNKKRHIMVVFRGKWFFTHEVAPSGELQY